MIVRISIPLTLFVSTYVVFVSGYLLANVAGLNQERVAWSIAILEQKQQRGIPPELRAGIGKILAERAASLSERERAHVRRAVTKYSRIHGHDPYLLLAMIETESSYRWNAVSKKGAVGLMQIRPFVARGLARELDMSPDKAVTGLKDLDTNVRIGSHYLAKMLTRFGDLSLALEAYNLGPTRLKSYIKRGKKLQKRYTRRVLRSKAKMIQIVDRSV